MVEGKTTNDNTRTCNMKSLDYQAGNQVDDRRIPATTADANVYTAFCNGNLIAIAPRRVGPRTVATVRYKVRKKSEIVHTPLAEWTETITSKKQVSRPLNKLITY